jgi:hypothetical protein
MISPHLIEEIQRLVLDGNLSRRKIAERLGVSRGTVNAVALGKRAASTNRRPQDTLRPPIGPLVRCAGCGGLVYSPCLLCRVRAYRAARRRRHCPASYLATRIR